MSHDTMLLPFLPGIVPDIVQALAIVLVFLLVCGRALRKHPLPFYAFFIVMSALTFAQPLKSVAWANGIVQICASAYTGVAFYLLVMFAGALPRGWKLTRMLLSLRTELSIIGGFIICAHVLRVIVTVPLSFTSTWRMIWGAAWPVMTAASAFVGIPLLLCFVIPWIMSFPGVRKKMTFEQWKKWQRLAYPFMALMVLQGALLNAGHAMYVGPASPDFAGYAVAVAFYAVVGVAYLALKLQQVAQRRARRAGTASSSETGSGDGPANA